MPRCGRPARRAVSRPVCAHEKIPAMSVGRKLLGTSKRASHPARPVPAVAPHGPRCSADACRSAIGRPILRPISNLSNSTAAAVSPSDSWRTNRGESREKRAPVLRKKGYGSGHEYGDDLASHAAQGAPLLAGLASQPSSKVGVSSSGVVGLQAAAHESSF